MSVGTHMLLRTHTQCTSAAATPKVSVYFMPFTSCGDNTNETYVAESNRLLYLYQQITMSDPTHTLRKNIAYGRKNMRLFLMSMKVCMRSNTIVPSYRCNALNSTLCCSQIGG